MLRTQSHKAEGFNELRFEDEAGEEQIWLHAQKDLELLTLNDRTEEIRHDSHLTVHNDRISEIHRDDHLTVQRHRFEHTRGSQHLSVEGTFHMQAGEAWLCESGRELHIKSGQKAVLEAGSEITLKVGGSFIQLNASGITLVGPQVKINAGGSPGSGSGQAVVPPKLPPVLEGKDHERAEAVGHSPLLSSVIEPARQLAALKQGSALTNICEPPDDALSEGGADE